ncbi:helix-turn-helix domain-containing protein [Cytobacillus gottheilii]|uniref:helix-turn-helix domain-containing protein n=1 Tax=Cytobacillus gottheilii TaxID=859144 RepID=UPI0009BB3008|nr:helix-turn-helix domain-containing protein [Cytobacillus gottheilii]
MIGIKVKYLRAKKGYSLNELAELAGVSKSYLSYIERGIQKNPSLQILERLADTLDTTVESLLDKEQDLSNLDEEWVLLIREAIENGITKEDFAYYLSFMKFKNAQKEESE